MTTTIIGNGSKWAGEEPDSVDALLDVLGREVLDRLFESELGMGAEAFISVCQPEEKWAEPGVTRFHGNFLDLSHVFSIDTDEPEIVGKLTAAIQANVTRPDYLEQPDPVARRAQLDAERAAKDRKRMEADQRQARAVLGLDAA